MKPKVRIEKWTIERWPGGGEVLTGLAHGHPRFPDGTYVRTSTIVQHHGGTVETLNTVYELGEPAQVH